MAHESEIINTYKHPFVGVRWPVTGSKGDPYTVTMRDSGFDCNCISFRKLSSNDFNSSRPLYNPASQIGGVI